MKKVLLILITLFIYSNVYALSNIELYISNENGAEGMNNSTIINVPYQTKVILQSINEEEANVLYNGANVIIKNKDLKPVKDTYEIIDGVELSTEGAVKAYTKSLTLYKGPNNVLFDEIRLTVPQYTEIAYKYVDNNVNPEYAYITYEGTSGWLLLNTSNENIAIKEQGTVIVTNSKSINLRRDFDGEYIELSIPDNTILNYDYVSKYQYRVSYNNELLWLSISNIDALAASSSAVVTANVQDKVYYTPVTARTRELYAFTESAQINAKFAYRNFYYIEYNDIKGWIKTNNNSNSSIKIVPTEKKEEVVEVPTIGTTEEKQKGKVPTKVELIIIISLAVLLLLSLTSLIAIVIMNKKKGGELIKNTNSSTPEVEKTE